MQWHIRKGSRRIVLALPNFGIALKIVRIRWRNIKDFLVSDVAGMYREMYASSRPDSKKLYREFVWLGSKRAFRQAFGGIGENWKEWVHYLYCPGPSRELLQPTYFSLFGLINIQRLGTPATDIALCMALCRIVWPDAAYDGHHWDTPANFDVSSSTLKVLDYGGNQTQIIIEKHHKALLAFRYQKP